MRWFTLLLMGCVSVHAAGAVINVPADQPTIQAAIIVAVNGDEIVVAEGTYNEAIDFLGKAVTVRSTDPTNPVVVMHTIINGTGFLHVVQCVNGEGQNTVLSGFVITGGNANGAGLDSQGGGMLNFNSSPTVTRCSFIQNAAINGGGGMVNTGVSSNPTVTDCTFISNSAFIGGGMYNISGSPTVTNCSFSGNTATNNGGGGGMLINNSSPALSNCSFNGNTADSEGGGMLITGASSPVVTDCIFCANSALVGGGMYNRGANSTIQGCAFTANTATESGGGMYNDSTSTIENCTFSGNTSGLNGGGVYNFGGNPTIDGCTFSANTAALGPIPAPGGGLHIDNGTPVLTNTGFCGNKAATIVGTWTDNGGNSLLYCPPPSPPSPDPCPADTNNSGTVNVTDLLQLLAAWGACP